MSCPDKMALRAYLTPEEYNLIKAKAAQAGLSVSVFTKLTCLGQEIKSVIDQKAVWDLLNLKADLGRLGGLLKLGLSEKKLDYHRTNLLLKGIEAIRKELETKVKTL